MNAAGVQALVERFGAVFVTGTVSVGAALIVTTAVWLLFGIDPIRQMPELVGIALISAGLVFAVMLSFLRTAPPGDRVSTTDRALSEELRATRERLETTEERFRNFADAASDWFWEMDADLRFTYFSPRSVEVVGVPVEFHLGKTRAELAGEDVTSEKWQRHLQDLELRRPFRDFRFIREGHDGRLQYLTSSGTPVFGKDGAFKGYFGIGSDITAQMEAESRARQANERLAAAVEALSELFVLWGPDDRLVVCNERFREMNAAVIETTEPGTPFADHIRAAMEKGLYPAAAGREEDWYAERLAQHANPGEPFELERQKGQWIFIHEQRLPDGSTVTISTDISKLKEAEQALRESEQRMRDYTDTAADWYWEQDADLRFSYFSTEREDVSGIVHNEHIGLTRRETNPGDVTESEMDAHEAVLNARQPFSDFRFSRQLPDGGKTYLSISGKPVYDTDGEFRGYRGAGRDITALVKAERRTVAARERAEAANRAKSDFLARVSHDLRTPLNAILGFSQIIQDQTFGPVGANNYVDYAGDIHASGEMLLALINDLLDLSRIEAGKYEIAEEAVRLDDLIGEVFHLFKEQANAAGLDFELPRTNGLPTLTADPRAARQALINLVSNAVKFTPEGGRIDISAAAPPGGIEITVSDTGIGFQADYLDTILEPFGRVENPSTRNVEGTGLGLAIVKSLMELHGGALELDSAPGRGTQATLRFPAQRTGTSALS